MGTTGDDRARLQQRPLVQLTGRGGYRLRGGRPITARVVENTTEREGSLHGSHGNDKQYDQHPTLASHYKRHACCHPVPPRLYLR